MGNSLFACCCRPFTGLLFWMQGEDWSGERAPLLGHKSPPQIPAKVRVPKAPWHPVLYPDIILSGAQHECLQSEAVDREVSSGNTGEKTSKASTDSCQVLSVTGLLQSAPGSCAAAVLLTDLEEELTPPLNYSKLGKICPACETLKILDSDFDTQGNSLGSNDGDAGSKLPASGSSQCQESLMQGKAASSGPALVDSRMVACKGPAIPGSDLRTEIAASYRTCPSVSHLGKEVRWLRKFYWMAKIKEHVAYWRTLALA